MAKVLSVRTPENDIYNILIGSGGLQTLYNNAEGVSSASAPRVVVVTNTTIAPLYGEKLVNALPNAHLVTMRDGEQYKTLETVHKLYGDFVRAGLDRNGVVFALGGGVVGDTAGFAAATYMRGVRLVQIPTSLLAMVDSSVGGKVGVDLPEGKNLVGAFKHPDMVMIDLDVLETLPDREWRNGMAEVIKHGLLADPTLLNPETRRDREEFIRRAIKVKVDVVQQDPYENDIRAHLNLGHTFAHAIERVTHYAVPHGEAVGIGLMAAAALSYRLGFVDSSLPEMVNELLVNEGLSTGIGSLDPQALYDAMATDKKFKNGRSRFILLRDVGKPFIMEDVPVEDVLFVLGQMAD